MRQFISLCDLCASDGTVTIATAKYRPEDTWFDCCEEHKEHIKEVFAREDQKVEIEDYETPGDITL